MNAGLEDWGSAKVWPCYWVAVTELHLSYYTWETRLITLCTHYGNPEPKPYIPYIPNNKYLHIHIVVT